MSPEAGNLIPILIVDDDEAFTEILSRRLSTVGYRVFSDNCGRSALETLKKNPEIKTVVSDMRMKNGNGWELAKGMQDSGMKMNTFILLTGFSDIPDETAHAAGVHLILQKPVPFTTLLEAIQKGGTLLSA